MEQLITEVRILIDDTTEPYDFTDEQVTTYINKYRRSFYRLAVYADDVHNLVYTIGYKNLASFSLEDSGENVIDSGDYTLDEINGIVTFTEEQYSPLYAIFTCHNLMNSAADIWKVRAAKATISGPYRLGDEQLPAGKESIEFCINKYWQLRQGTTHLMER